MRAGTEVTKRWEEAVNRLQRRRRLIYQGRGLAVGHRIPVLRPRDFLQTCRQDPVDIVYDTKRRIRHDSRRMTRRRPISIIFNSNSLTQTPGRNTNHVHL